jgi:hypothetical protein
LLKDADQARFDRLRYVEVKHGRIAMAAILGHLVTTAGVRFPGAVAEGVPFTSVKAGLAAFEDIPALSTFIIIASVGLIEYGFALRQEEIEEAQLTASGWDAETIEKKKGKKRSCARRKTAPCKTTQGCDQSCCLLSFCMNT